MVKGFQRYTRAAISPEARAPEHIFTITFGQMTKMERNVKISTRQNS